MKQIRRNIFETNSSSVHSLTICKREDYERWKTDGTYMYECDDEIHFVSRDEAIGRYNCIHACDWKTDFIDPDYMTDEEIDEKLALMEMYSYESWEKHHEDFETYAQHVEIDSSGSYIAFGHFGRDC